MNRNHDMGEVLRVVGDGVFSGGITEPRNPQCCDIPRLVIAVPDDDHRALTIVFNVALECLVLRVRKTHKHSDIKTLVDEIRPYE